MNRTHIVGLCALLALLLLPLGGFSRASAQQDAGADPPAGSAGAAAGGEARAEVGQAFTFQGALAREGAPVNGACDFRFSLWDKLTGGATLGTANTFNGLVVEEGAFRVVLTFLNQFTGDERFVQTEVRCAGDGAFVTLAPRQRLHPVPYAIGLRPGAVVRSGEGGDGFYVEKSAADSVAIRGTATAKGGLGVLGESSLWAGVWGQSSGASGVVGISKAKDSGGIYGENTGPGYGVYGKAADNVAVFGQSTASNGVYGWSTFATGVVGESASHDGVLGTTKAPNRIGVKGVANAAGAVGVWGESAANTGVYGLSSEGIGVWGASKNGDGVYGATNWAGGQVAGVRGENTNALGGVGVQGKGYVGVYGRWNGTPNSIGVFGDNGGSNTSGYAGNFNGRVRVIGNLSKGGGSFLIDHPLDPQNKTLSHSFVESPDMKNIYDGIAVLDATGGATVALPAYFEALNRDFRYQLTTIGSYAPVYIAQEVSGNQFKIGGGQPGLKVSWQVTGIRHDPYAEHNPIVVEQDKPAAERGRYLYPTAYGRQEDEGIRSSR
jgi:hypothetical protein